MQRYLKPCSRISQALKKIPNSTFFTQKILAISRILAVSSKSSIPAFEELSTIITPFSKQKKKF